MASLLLVLLPHDRKRRSMKEKMMARKRNYRKLKVSKAERVLGGFFIESLGIIAVLAMFVFARQLSEPSPHVTADTLPTKVISHDQNAEHEWRDPFATLPHDDKQGFRIRFDF